MSESVYSYVNIKAKKCLIWFNTWLGVQHRTRWIQHLAWGSTPDSVDSTPDSGGSTPDSVDSTPDSVDSTPGLGFNAWLEVQPFQQIKYHIHKQYVARVRYPVPGSIQHHHRN